jgi:[ribosomal protein S18]-alanine N-acetyltransferase
MTWQLRRAAPDDLDAIMTLETPIFAPDDWSREIMAAELGDQHGVYLVAFRPESPGSIEAYGGVRAPVNAEQADIQTIAVAPTARRQGLGRVLMLQLVEQARQRGAREVFLEVRADNPGAQALYESLGFERIATRARYYRGGIDAEIMRLRIPEPQVRPA